MGLAETVTSVIAPCLEPLGVELVDVEHKGVVVRVVVDEPGGINLDRLGEITHTVSRALDEADPIAGHYTLEVSSPGVERPLRTPRHFQAAVGQKVTFKHADGPRTQRRTGVLLGADDDAIDVQLEPERSGASSELVRVRYACVDRARTVFEWGPAPKPGKGSKPGAAKGAKSRDAKVAGERAKAAATPGAPDQAGTGGNSEMSTVGEQGSEP